MTISSDTAMPNAPASASEEPKPMTAVSVPAASAQLTNGTSEMVSMLPYIRAMARPETAGLFQAQNAGEQSDFRFADHAAPHYPSESRGFLCTGKPRRFAGTAWWSGGDSN